MAISTAKRNIANGTGDQSMRIPAALALAAALALGGCSSSGPDNPATGQDAVPAEVYAPVEAVREIEIGRTRDGIVLTAIGVAPGLGYSVPELRARREGQIGPDGFLDFDFVAKAPDPRLQLGEGSPQARTVRADLHLKSREVQGATGLRVHGIAGGLQVVF